MGNIPFTVDAEQLEKLRVAFFDLVGQSPIVPRPETEASFTKIALEKKFRAGDAIKILLDKAPTYYGQKECLFAALGAWVAEPLEQGLRQKLVYQTALEIVQSAELKADDINGKYDRFSDFLARYFICGTQFLDEIYYESGGIHIYVEASSRELLGITMSMNNSSIYSTIRLMAYFHLLSENFNSDKYFHPSLNKGLLVIRDVKRELKADLSMDVDVKLRDSLVSRTIVHSAWTERKESLALLYASSLIKSGREKTLLDRLLEADLSFDRDFKLLERWLGMARYFCEVVLSRMHDDDLYKKNVGPLSLVEPRRFTSPNLENFEKQILQKRFRRSQ